MPYGSVAILKALPTSQVADCQITSSAFFRRIAVQKIRKGTWEIPPIFPFLQEKGRVDEAEMYHVFNMGVGMVLVLPPSQVDTAIALLQELGESPALIGEITYGERSVRII